MKKIILFVISSLIYCFISFLFIFYLDLANGPMALLFVEIGLILTLFFFKFVFWKKRFFIRHIPIVLFVVISIVVACFAKPTIQSIKAYNNKDFTKTEILQLENGKIQGVLNDDKSVQIYAGIPYAKAPIGNLRWKEPQDVDNWEGVKECFSFAPKSMQPDSNPVMDSLVRMYSMKGWYPDYKMQPSEPISEDSLYLNIWRPNNNKTNLPILVYIHGGSLTSGSSAFEDYNGESVAKKDVIMITIAYRLGIFGYFAHQQLIDESINHTTGNYGLLDQIKALEWISDILSSPIEVRVSRARNLMIPVIELSPCAPRLLM